jgi:hydrogenase nickel incorporation protein HypA/HybF
MHEAALALSLEALVRDTLKGAGAARAASLQVEIGALSHVEPMALAQAFEIAAKGGPADGARVEISRPPGAAVCMACGATSIIRARGDGCAVCGSHKLLVTGGDEMRLKSVEAV